MRDESVKKSGTERGVLGRINTIGSLREGDRTQLAHKISGYLADRSPRVRAAALDVVREEELREMDEQVLNLLSDKNRSVRYSAVECLGSLHEGEAVGASWLYPLLKDPFRLVRIETLESLARVGDRTALPLIAESLQDEDALARAYAARSIAELDGREYVTDIESALKTETDDNARAGFAEALFLLGDNEQFLTLLELLSSTEYLARCASANALTELSLSPGQVQSALVAVAHAARNALFGGDKSTMERVEKELREQL
jgi:HEAT repeat protein